MNFGLFPRILFRNEFVRVTKISAEYSGVRGSLRDFKPKFSGSQIYDPLNYRIFVTGMSDAEPENHDFVWKSKIKSVLGLELQIGSYAQT
jgi:hypothetical protein